MSILYETLLQVTPQQVVMWIIGGVLIFLAIKKEMEPTLLLPIGFGTILVNLPLSGALTHYRLGEEYISLERYEELLAQGAEGLHVEHGALDVLLGPLATGLAAWLTYGWRRHRIGGLPVLSTLPPVLLNAVIIGAELTVVLFPERTPALFFINMLSVGIGQVIACVIGGLLLFTVLKRVPTLKNYWE